MNLPRVVVVTIATAVALVLSACASAPGSPADPGDARLSVVFGYFDMKQAPSPVEWLSLKPSGEHHNGGYRMPGDRALFLHVAVEPGAYHVDRFGGMGGVRVGGLSLFGANHQIRSGARTRNDSAISISRPGVYYLGAYEYVSHQRGWPEPDGFEMRPLATMSERDLLLKVQRRLESETRLQPYAHQLEMVRQRVAELSR